VMGFLRIIKLKERTKENKDRKRMYSTQMVKFSKIKICLLGHVTFSAFIKVKGIRALLQFSAS